LWRAQTRPRASHQLTVANDSPQTWDLHGFFIRAEIMIAFVPAWAHHIIYGFYAGVAAVAFFASRRLLRFAITREEPKYFVSWAKNSWANFATCVFAGAMAVYLTTPRLFKYADVNAVAKPGVSYSSVVEQLGQPSWKTIQRNGNMVIGYDTGLVIGSVTATVSPDGIVTDVGFSD